MDDDDDKVLYSNVWLLKDWRQCPRFGRILAFVGKSNLDVFVCLGTVVFMYSQPMICDGYNFAIIIIIYIIIYFFFLGGGFNSEIFFNVLPKSLSTLICIIYIVYAFV